MNPQPDMGILGRFACSPELSVPESESHTSHDAGNVRGVPRVARGLFTGLSAARC